MNNNIEILAPAGNPEALKAAVFSGCDAVYLGGSLFSARANAGNFDNEELKEAVRFCHVRGVKVYVTVNTLVKETELIPVMNFISFLCEIGVDAVLVQDLGLFRLIRESCPDMPVHASTQMSVLDKNGARLLKDMGASRVVLSREMSLKEIKDVSDNADVELEVFVHGALCMSVSGQCYFSAMLGSRSGNRGRCAQPCRLPFSTDDGKKNVLSLKDLSFITRIEELKNAGVCSAKIEGRMKRPEYVAAAVSAGRSAADGKPVNAELMKNLEAVFSRSGFTEAYLTGKTGPDMFGIRTKDDVTAGSNAVFNKLHELYKGEANRVPVHADFEMQVGMPAKLTLSDFDGNEVSIKSDVITETAQNRPLDEEGVKKQLEKLGSTAYHLESASVKLDGKGRIPMSAINEMRRTAAEKLDELRGSIKQYSFTEPELDEVKTEHAFREMHGVFSSFSQLSDCVSKLDMIYLPITESLEHFEHARKYGVKVGAVMPRSFFGADEELERKAELLVENGFDDFLCGNIGGVAIVRNVGGKVHGAFSLNAVNTESLKTLGNLGLSDTELSFELTLDEISELKGGLKRGIMAYGRQALMLNRACPIGHGKCIGCKKVQCITDRKGYKFPVMCMKGKTFRSVEVLNSLPLNLSDRQGEIKNVDYITLRFTDETRQEVEKVINAFVNHEKLNGEFTKGLYYRGII